MSPAGLFVPTDAVGVGAGEVLGRVGGCQIDAGWMPVVWLTGVKQEESIAALRGIAERENSDSALMAIGLHETSAATRVLSELASARQSLRLREKASFWLATERGTEGLPALQQLAHDADARFREKITFHLTLVTDPRAVDELIRMAEGDTDYRVVLTPDKNARTLTVADNGIGMNHDELVENLGTIARSGTASFMNQLSGDARKDMSLIGQFGVGFYSAFMVADKVEVRSKKAGDSEGWRWTSDGKG